MQSKKRADELADELIAKGIQAASYHAGLENEDRQFIQQQFLNGALEWIVATNAFGMGVHKNNIRQIIHEAMPASVANYLQEVGRAGRDGLDALAYILVAPADIDTAYFIAEDDLPTEEHLQAFLQHPTPKYNAELFFAQYRMSETIFRVIQYWLSIENVENLKLRLQQMRLTKRREVEIMASIVNGDDCIREKVVNYFGQSFTPLSKDCCSNCGLEESNYLLSRESNGTEESDETWEMRLKRLLY